MVKNLPAVQETWVRSLGQEDPLEKGRAPHCSALAWRIPWTQKPGGHSPRGLKELDTAKRPRQQLLKCLSSCSSGCSGAVYCIYLWRGWAFTVAVRRGYPSLRCVGFSLQRLLLLRSSRLVGSIAVVHVDLPGPGMEPMAPALAGGFLSTTPPGKSHKYS